MGGRVLSRATEGVIQARCCRETPLLASVIALAAPEAAEIAPIEGPTRFALVVGSSRPGPGQAALRWSTADVNRLEQALVDVGGFDRTRVTEVLDPTRDELLAAMDDVASDIAAARTAGERPELLVYYSGHAWIQGLQLGREVLAAEAFQTWLDEVPASLRLVVVDACHAAGLAGSKGAQVSAPFAVTTLRGTQTEGIAVLASSAASELAQESDVLEGSYFTTHLVAGLRGAADADGDQVVTLDELYRYTYDRTLTATSETPAGAQHPVLQTRLVGMGGVVMSRLGASTVLTFDARDEGRMLFARRDTGRVEAEVDKPAGRRLSLVVPTGDYDVWLTRRSGRVLRCRFEVPRATSVPFEPDGCRLVEAAGVAKGRGSRRPIEPVGVARLGSSKTCSLCVDVGDCPGQVCGLSWTSTVLGAHRACVDPASKPPGTNCATDAECETGLCRAGQCSQCTTDCSST